MSIGHREVASTEYRFARRGLRPRCTRREALSERTGVPKGVVGTHRDPAAFQRRRVDPLGHDQHAQRERDATRSCKPLRSAPAGQLARPDLGKRHRRVLADDTNICCEQELGSRADRGTVPHSNGRRRERGEQSSRISEALRSQDPRLDRADTVARVEQQRSWRIGGKVREGRDERRARGRAEIGERDGCERDCGDAHSPARGHAISLRIWRARSPRRVPPR